MNPIKDFFRKKTVEQKFKKAGPGHKLADQGSSTAVTHRPKAPVAPIPRHQQSESAKKAGEAALARLEQKQTAPVNWSLAAVRAQAKKELELEVQAAENIKEAPKEVIQECCPVLSVSGVYFSCPIIGPFVLSRSEIEAKLKEFLYAQLAEEMGLTACLIIHTCNKDKEKVRLGVETLARYLTNIMDNPTEEKYRKIRINNRIFQERVAILEGACEFLLAAGFCEQTLEADKENYYVYPEDKLADLDNLQMLKEALFCAEPIYPELDRNKKVLLPSQVTGKVNLPNDFFNLSPEEVLKEQEARAQVVELGKQLRTKEMKERDAIREMRIYRYSLIRIRFPDDLILQGTFKIREKLSAVKGFITENLAQPERNFTLLAPGGFKLTDDENTLYELRLVPAAILNLQWINEDDKSTEEIAYLNPETMLLLQDL